MRSGKGYSDAKVANRDFTSRDIGWEIAHAAVTRRPPISLYTLVARTGGYAYDVGVWDLSIIQGPFSVAPCQTLTLRFATSSSLHRRRQVRIVDAEGWPAASAHGSVVGSEADAVRLLREMLAAVAALHVVGVVHADIKVRRTRTEHKAQ